jgi:hypothetical protein
MVNKAVNLMLSFQLQLKVLHWQTQSYAQHIAFGSMYDYLDGAIDKFVEVYQGKYGRLTFPPESQANTFEIADTGKVDINTMLKGFEEFLTFTLPKLLTPVSDTDLLNIRDEILAEVNKLKYLLTLK